jgi:hypothetical protein
MLGKNVNNKIHIVEQNPFRLVIAFDAAWPAALLSQLPIDFI